MLLLLACQKPSPPPVAVADDTPRLPAPRAAMYTHAPSTPGDPVVAAALKGAAWDEALSGAAAGVALEILGGNPVDAYRLRWRAVLAGYPYPVVERAQERVAEGVVPEGLVEQARVRAATGADIGLVRARDKEGDLWVLLVGDRRATLGRVPREVALGESIELAGATWVVSDPHGSLRPAATRLSFDMPGEWLLQARTSAGVVATMPVYVSTPTPTEPPILDDARGDAVVMQAQDLLGAMWSWYGRGTASFDSGLDAVARVRLRELRAGHAPADVTEQLRAVGFGGVPVAAGECRGPTLAACLDGMWWSPERRAVLVGGYADVGVAAEARDGQVWVAMVAAG